MHFYFDITADKTAGLTGMNHNMINLLYSIVSMPV